MRIANAQHEARPWRIRELTHDFTLLDVWALPMHGDADEFPAAVEHIIALDPMDPDSLPARVLWRIRDRLGAWFHLGRISEPDAPGTVPDPIPGTQETSLAERLPDDLRGTTADLELDDMLFEPLYRTDDEFASEISNRTVHGVLHLAWVDQGEGRYQAQMAVYVKPRGRLGKAYMTLISPFRHFVVYPALMRQIERGWNERTPH